MKAHHILPVLFLVGVLGVAVTRGQEAFQRPISNWTAVAGGQERLQKPIPNWSAPSSWSPARPSEEFTTMGAVTSPLPFIGITPCRVADTRGAAGPYGGPALVGGGPARTFNIPAGPCPGIPTTAGAYSINVAAILPASDGFMTVFPTGAAQPTSSNLNFLGGRVIANALIAPAGTNGSIDVFVNVSTNMILDINGYYAGAGVGAQSTFLGLNAGNFTMTGDNNTGFGHNALFSNTTGSGNTATGNNALANNNMGGFNTASGAGALFSNTTGSSNIGIGAGAGINLTTGSNNICIGNFGIAGESGTIRIGTVGTQTATFVAGVNGVMTGGTGTPVLIDAIGQLGTISSSARFKDEIQDMGEATEGLLKLRPVTFRYKAQPEGRRQFGLIAEEVEKVMPELVVCSSSGEVETVLYHEMPAMLLNELQKQQRQIQELKSELSALRAVIGQK